MSPYVLNTALKQAAAVVEELSTEATNSWDFTEYIDGPDELKTAGAHKSRLLQLWSTRLVFAGIELQGEADRLFASVRHVSAPIWSRNEDLGNVLLGAQSLAQSADAFRQEVGVCCSQLVAVPLGQKESLLSSLADVADHLDERISWTVNTVNRKLYEASTTRLTYANLVLSGTAIVITLVSMLVGN